jgi:hypothetical protein
VNFPEERVQMESDQQQQLSAYRALRGPAWRLSRAAELPPNRTHRRVDAADPAVREVHHFQQLCREGDAGRTRAEARYPAIAGAYALNRDETKSEAAKILTLGDCPRGEIAAHP